MRACFGILKAVLVTQGGKNNERIFRRGSFIYSLEQWKAPAVEMECWSLGRMRLRREGKCERARVLY